MVQVYILSWPSIKLGKEIKEYVTQKPYQKKLLNHDIFSSIAAKLINIQWIRTGSQLY